MRILAPAQNTRGLAGAQQHDLHLRMLEAQPFDASASSISTPRS
jgi:hypothetical protein